LAKIGLVSFSDYAEGKRVNGARCAGNSTRKKQTMKKIIILAAVLGFAAALTVKAADVKENWDNLCAKCHGADGKGQTKMGQKLGVKDLTDAKIQAQFKDEDAVKGIKEGRKDADGKTLMKAFDTLSDDEIKALAAYVRGLKS
jgi:cytochrome c553